jgi:hypothetical protein
MVWEQLDDSELRREGDAASAALLFVHGHGHGTQVEIVNLTTKNIGFPVINRDCARLGLGPGHWDLKQSPSPK